MTKVKGLNVPVFTALAVAGVLMAGVVGPHIGNDVTDRKVTFDAQVGDGKSWAGGFTFTYTVGTKATPVTVMALPRTDVSRNGYRITKSVLPGTAISLRVGADWPGKPIRVQFRGLGVDTRPMEVISPHEALIVATVK